MQFNTFTKKCFFVLIIASFGLTFSFKIYSIPSWFRVCSFFAPTTRKAVPPRQTFYIVDGRQQPDGQHRFQPITSDNYPEIFEYQRDQMEAARSKIQHGENITNFNLTTSDGIEFPVKFFNRNSRTLIVIGGGLTSKTRSGNFYAATFHDYNVIKFDYRWGNLLNFLRHKSTWLHPIRTLFDDCAEEVTTVVDYARQSGKYDQIIGLSTCYSTYTFSRAQSLAEEQERPLFDKLIIDSSFSSLPTAICRYFSNLLEKKTMSRIFSPILKMIPTRFAIQHHLAPITQPPILFIHGSRDWLLSLREFREEIWPYTTAPNKALLVTPFNHVGSMRGNPYAYKYFCTQFIENDFK